MQYILKYLKNAQLSHFSVFDKRGFILLHLITALRKLFRVQSVISVNAYYISVF